MLEYFSIQVQEQDEVRIVRVAVGAGSPKNVEYHFSKSDFQKLKINDPIGSRGGKYLGLLKKGEANGNLIAILYPLFIFLIFFTLGIFVLIGFQ